MALETLQLERWNFAFGENRECLKTGKTVTVPHTWNVEEGLEDAWGTGWYETVFQMPENWEGKKVRLFFGAVNHDAVVWVNGSRVGEHRSSGYTPFEMDITDALLKDTENVITVQADNCFSEEALPYKRSFDWANDGGLIRKVELRMTENLYIRQSKITARPVIVTDGERQDDGYGVFGAKIEIGGMDLPAADADMEQAGLCMADRAVLCWELQKADSTGALYSGECVCSGLGAVILGIVLEKIRYWHFDAPELYTLKMRLVQGGRCLDQSEVTFGFREFRVDGSRFFLNGEAVRLCGTEWMPGSDPEYGMAEPVEQLEKMLVCLKESNCVFTRFHWQQDEAVFDWCDRHGILVQEEIPFWGGSPAVPGETQKRIFREQMKEMTDAHYNHPSIIAWGVGNELRGQEEDTIQYVKEAVAYTHSLDSTRPANYVSNSFCTDSAKDATIKGDVLMINEYAGTWMTGIGEHEILRNITDKNPGKPVVPSEFGLCEPTFEGGDERRNQIFLEKMQAYRCYPQVAGTINFCLNDYRTQMGEDGEGKLRKRIHGSTDLCGNPKPSYRTVQKECAPFRAEERQGSIRLVCMDTLPSYTMKGYYGVLASADGAAEKVSIPELRPGEAHVIGRKLGQSLKIYRPNGDFCGEIR